MSNLLKELEDCVVNGIRPNLGLVEKVIDEMQMLDSKESSSGVGAGSNPSQSTLQQSPSTASGGNDIDNFDDDIPF